MRFRFELSRRYLLGPLVLFTACGPDVSAETWPAQIRLTRSRADTEAVGTDSRPSSQQTLRNLATARGFEIGVAVRDTPFVRDPLYRQVLTAQYNSIGTEDATDFGPIHPGPTTYAFANADALVAFAQANGMRFHGHTLIWGSWIPNWVTKGNYTRASCTRS